MNLKRSPYCLLVALSMLITSSAPGEEIDFADDHFIAAAIGVERTITVAKKLPEPVIRGDKPWQQNPYTYGSVIYDDEQGIYKAWYQSINADFPVQTPILYATSKDGRKWEFPNLGIIEVNGSTNNNMVMTVGHLYSPSVIKDDKAKDPARKYKLAYWDIGPGGAYGGKGGMYVAFSPDGIHWTRYQGDTPRIVAEKRVDSVSDVLDVMLDPKSGKYLLYTKCWNWDGAKPLYRMIARAESDDFTTWTRPQTIVDTRKEDAKQPQTYGMPVFAHQGHYYGMLRVYHKPGNETIEIELTHSRDGVNFHRVAPGQAILPVGKSGTWDDGMVFTAPPIVRDDTVEIFYGGWDGPHNTRNRNAAIGLATLPVDRLIAMTPTGAQGALRTTPLKIESGQAIVLNADTKNGFVRASLLDEDGSTIPGYTLSDSRIIKGDDRALKLRWNGRDLTDLPERICLLIELNDGALVYGATIAPPH